MAFGWSKTSLSPIAVDFGFDSLKLLQIHPTDPTQMVAAVAVTMPEQARHDASARHEFYNDSLRQILKQQSFKGRQAICSIPSYQTVVQNLQVSKSDSDDIHAQISQHLRHRLNVDPSRMVVRWFQEVSGSDTARQDVVCVAASRQVVMRYIDMAQRAKLDLVGMHCEPLAILRAFAYLFRRSGDEKRTTCFIDIGAATTKVAIAHGAKLAFAKTIHTAADQLTRHYAQVQGLDFAAARQKRMAEAVMAGSPAACCSGVAVLDAPEARPNGDCRVNGQLGQQEQAIAASAHAEQNAPSVLDGADALDCLIDEVRLCVRYHRSVYPDRPVEKLVFLGGEARHARTCQQVAQALRISAQLGDPLARMVRPTDTKATKGLNLREPQPAWAVPMGLCQCEQNL